MKKQDLIIRLENSNDYRHVENLIRESFFNVYRPGCFEHYVMHTLRDDPDFIKDLCFVMEKNGEYIGQNMFMKANISADDGQNIPVLTMGPFCITPKLQRHGLGRMLLDYSLNEARKLHYGAVLFEGDISFYGKCGFDYASKFGIRYHGLPKDADASFFLCRELVKDYLRDVTGVYATPQGYLVNSSDVEEFDKGFPYKKKERLKGQLFN